MLFFISWGSNLTMVKMHIVPILSQRICTTDKAQYCAACSFLYHDNSVFSFGYYLAPLIELFQTPKDKAETPISAKSFLEALYYLLLHFQKSLMRVWMVWYKQYRFKNICHIININRVSHDAQSKKPCTVNQINLWRTSYLCQPAHIYTIQLDC